MLFDLILLYLMKGLMAWNLLIHSHLDFQTTLDQFNNFDLVFLVVFHASQHTVQEQTNRKKNYNKKQNNTYLTTVLVWIFYLPVM